MTTEHVTISSTMTGNLMKLSYVYVPQPHISYILTLLIPLQNGRVPVRDSHSQIDGTLECERRHVQIAKQLCGLRKGLEIVVSQIPYSICVAKMDKLVFPYFHQHLNSLNHCCQTNISWTILESITPCSHLLQWGEELITVSMMVEAHMFSG